MRIQPPGSAEYAAAKHRLDEANQQDTHDAMPADDPTPMTYEETEQKVHDLWNAGDRIGAMEAVLGHRIDARDLADDPDLSMIFRMPTADEAFGAMLIVRDMSAPQFVAGKANPDHVRIVAELLKKD